MFFRLAPSYFSFLPIVQRWVHNRLGGVVAESARVHFTATYDGGGGVTIGPDVTIEKDVQILTSWKIYDLNGAPMVGGGDVIIHESATVRRGVSIHAGSIILPGETIATQAEADARAVILPDRMVILRFMDKPVR